MAIQLVLIIVKNKGLSSGLKSNLHLCQKTWKNSNLLTAFLDELRL